MEEEEEEERCWGMKENTIPAVLGGAPEPNPPRLTLGISSQWCSPDSRLSLCFFLLFWGISLMFWSSAIHCHLLVSCRVRKFWAHLDLGSQRQVLPLRWPCWDMGMCHLNPIQSLSHPCPIPILLKQTLIRNSGLRVFGKVFGWV